MKRIGNISGKGLWMRQTGILSRSSSVPTGAAVFSAAALRDVNGVGKLPSVYPGTPSAIVMNRRCLHQNSVRLRLQWS